MAGGALAYVRSASVAQRARALLAGMTLSWAATTVRSALYWDGRFELWMRETAHWYVEVLGQLVAGEIQAALIFAPALLRLSKNPPEERAEPP